MTIFVPSEAPSVVVMVPQNEKIRGKSGCWRGTKGAAPGPRRGRGAECPRAKRETFLTGTSSDSEMKAFLQWKDLR